MLFKTIKNILWDWNGTLLDDLWLCLESINSLLADRELPTLDQSSYHKIFGFPVQDYYAKAGFDFTREDFKIPAKQFIDLYYAKMASCQLQDGAKKLLRLFHREGIRQYILSASETEVLEQLIKDHRLDPYLSGIYGLNDHYAAGKVAIGKRLMIENSLNPSETVLIGDTIHDREVAQSLGVRVILFTGGHHPAYRLEESGIQLVDKLESLLPLFDTQ